MDVLAVTDFPDIRLKCAIYSANQGNILIIPREGGYLVRLVYRAGRRHATRRCSRAGVSPRRSWPTVANRILHPYSD